MENKETESGEALTTSSAPKQESEKVFLKPGDKVIVTRQTTKEEDIPGMRWPAKKISCVGKTGTIVRQRTKADDDRYLEDGIGDRECYYVLMDDEDLRGLDHGWTFQRSGLKKLSKWKAKQESKEKISSK